MRIIVVPRTRQVDPPSIPVVTATAAGPTQIDLTASSISTVGIARYFFEVATSASGPWTALTDNASGTYSHTGLSEGSTRYYRAYATDTLSQSSSRSGAVGASTPSGSYRKAYWGHWVGYNGTLWSGFSDGAIRAVADIVLPNARVKGFTVKMCWKAIELSQNDYSGLDEFEELLNYNRDTYGKPTGLEIFVQSYGGNKTDAAAISADRDDPRGSLPDYIHDLGYSGAKPNIGGIAFKLMSSGALARYSALFAAIAARFDDNPYFVGVWTDESATEYSGFDDEIRNEYWRQFLVAMADHYRHSNLTIINNWIVVNGSGTDARDLAVTCAQYGWGNSGTEIDVPERGHGENHGAKVYRGVGVDYVYDFPGHGSETQNYGTTDYRNVFPYLARMDQAYTTTLTEAWNYARDLLKPRIISWTYDTSGSYAWSTLLAKINANTGANDAVTYTAVSSFGGLGVSSPAEVP